jgi:diguanylate cyclase (GGDEF)-like protein/PAS domain S-box-containing protein
MACSFLTEAKPNNTVLERITVEDGLSQASVLAIAQDKQGYLWFGTENGIDIYDGYTISPVAGPDGDFNKFTANSIYTDSHGLVWIALFGKGLYTYDPARNTYQKIIKNDPENQELNVWQVVEDKSRNLYWFITEKSALSYDLSSKKIQERIDFSKYFNSIDVLYNVKILHGRLVFLTRVGTFIYDANLKQLTQLPRLKESDIPEYKFNATESAKTYDIVLVGDDYFLGTNDGVFNFTEQNLAKFLQNQSTDISYNIAIENISIWQLKVLENIVYAASTHGLYRYNKITNTSEYLFKFGEYFNTVADANIISILSDNNGQLWLGSQSSGVYRWDPKTEIVKTFTYDSFDKNSLSNGNISSIVSGKDNQFWVGTGQGLNLVDIKTNSIKRFLEDKEQKTTFTTSNIYEIAKDYLGRLWLSTAKGIHLFDTETKKLIVTDFPEPTKKLLNVENSWATIESINEYIWLVSESGIHTIHAATGELNSLANLPNNFDTQYIWHVMASFTDDKDEVLFSSTDTLWLYNQRTKNLTQIYHQKGLPKEGYSYVDNWARDEQGLIWLSYPQVGLIAISPNDYQVQYFFNEHNSILDVNIYGVQVDSENNIWVSSHSGLFRLRASDKHMRRFNKLDGLASSEFNDGAYYHLADGRFAYGGISGISLFDPIILGNKNSASSNTVSIVNVNTLSRSLNSPHILPNNYQIELEHDDFGIRIDFSSFSYDDNESPMFKYGFVDGVSFPEARQNFVTFPRLDSGNYTFQVQVKSEETGLYSEPAFVKIKVKYAPWKSPLAFGIYGFIIILGIFIWFRSRQQRQKELLAAHEKVKNRENRLQLALSASNSEVWDWQASNSLIFAKRLGHDLGYDEQELAVPFSRHVELIHPEDQNNFSLKWRSFIRNADPDANFECSYRLKCANKNWLWYRDVGKIVAFDDSGAPSRITGSYTNITESKAVQERAQYYGAAFEQTRDWVLIFDEAFEVGRANKSMTDVFGWSTEELKLSDGLRGVGQDRINYYRKLLPIILAKGYWRGEELIETPDGKEYHVITNISVSVNIEHQQRHFICVYTDISAQKSAENELRIMANYDHLTGLPNRTLLLDRIEHAIAASHRRKDSIALFFIDLDRFKQVNDSLGHECGDILLKEVSKRLAKSLREDDTLARIGGDEFVVLLERFRSNNELSGIAQKFIDIVQQPFTLNSHVVSIGASIGISLYPNDAEDSEELFRNADVAMYHAKQLGRNNYQFFTDHMNKEAKQRLTKETNLKLGVANKEFFNVYQPIIDAHSGKSVGAELLMRWLHHDVVVPPVEFITLAEELGLIVVMTEQAIARGFEELKRWRKLRPDFYLSVNFSAKHFSDSQLINSIKSLLAQFDLPAKALKIEITENAFIYEPEKAIETMHKLSAMGVLLSLDDFGTGFSSLTYLKQLPLDIIKIDRSFVDGIGEENTDEAIVDATLVLAKSLNMYCIAEGVETEEQLNYLVERNCHYIQGYLYYKPLSAADFIEKLEENSVEIKAMVIGSDAAHS